MAVARKLLQWSVNGKVYAMNLPSVYGSAIETKLGYSAVTNTDNVTLIKRQAEAIQSGVLLRCTFRVATPANGYKSVRGFVPADNPSLKLDTCRGTSLVREIHVAGSAAATSETVGEVTSASVKTRSRIQY
jgi:hypothetical protein